jgi:sugar phosphate isomerase/epimerase
MKIAVSSAAFAAAFTAGTTTQLEWLDACANELEVDGVIFHLADFPRTDSDYLAQLKKSATDLGLTVAAIASDALPDANAFGIAAALGAPLAIARAPVASDDATAWSAFVESAKTCARAAKAAGVVAALANVPGTLCATTSDLKRISYDVDGSWLRYALDPLAATDGDDLAALLAKTVIVASEIGELTTFATSDDARAQRLVYDLARFRGFVVLNAPANGTNAGAYHDAIARFTALRATALYA